MIPQPNPWPVSSWTKKFRLLVRENTAFTMANLIDRLADLYEERPLFFLDRPLDYPFFRGEVVSYRDTERLVNRIGNVLKKLGVTKGARVALATTNRIEMAFALFAITKIGGIVVPLNAMLKAGEIRYLLEDAGCTVLITDRTVFAGNIRDRSELPGVKSWVMVGGEVPPGFINLGELMGEAAEELPPEPLSADDVVLISYTAGTTGTPKGAMLTNGGFLFTLRRYLLLSAFLPTPRRQLSLLVMPLAHPSGYQPLLFQTALAIPMILLSRFDPQQTLEMIQALRVTFFAGVPAMFRMLLEAGAERYDLSSIRVWGGGADSFPDQLVRTLRRLASRRKLGVTLQPLFIRGYGLAETAGQVSIALPGALGDACLGWILPGIKFQIIGEDEKPVRKGEVGELILQGPSIMKGYWGNQSLTKKVLRNGWFHTGDLVRRGRFGLLYMASREKEVIKCGGYSVFPAEVERQLVAHPHIEQAVVAGLPHEVKGEMPIAAVVLKTGARSSPEEILAWAKEHIAPYKCPREIVIVEAIPLSPLLKPKRAEVREMLLQSLRAQESTGRTPPAAAEGRS